MSHSNQKNDRTSAEGEENFERLLESVYDELRRIAHIHQANEFKNLTLQTTALVHEAYLRLVSSQNVARPSSENHLKALTSRIIRRLLVDNARKRNAQKRNPDFIGEEALRAELVDQELEVDLLDLDEALNQLAHRSKRLEQVTELRFFGGLTNEEVAVELGISSRTVERDWQKARMYLLDSLQSSENLE